MMDEISLFRKIDDKTIVQSTNRLESIHDAHSNEMKEGNEEHIDTTDAMEDYLEVMYELIQKKGMPQL